MEGGIKFPYEYDDYYNNQTENSPFKPITMLITGSPGSGKSTLALELCLKSRLFKHNNDPKGDSLNCLYISNEAEKIGLDHKKKKYDWSGDIFELKVPKDKDVNTNGSGTYVLGANSFNNLLNSKVDEKLTTTFKKLFSGNVNGNADAKQEYIAQKITNISPKILVIDSLNSIKNADKTEMFQFFNEITNSVPSLLLVVFILDSGTDRSKHEYWGYVSDMIVRIDKYINSDYLIRSIEVEKARYQQHIWGKQQLKFNRPFSRDKVKEENPEQAPQIMRRHHPFNKEGGIFIYPSIHYYLSLYKRVDHESDISNLTTNIDGFNDLTAGGKDKGGFPKGRCIGIVGHRGGHKSHIGYSYTLHRLQSSDTNTPKYSIIVSLRDDEEMTRNTLNTIAKSEFGKTDDYVKDIIDKQQLEILYFLPGNITPEEVFHRIYITIKRIKRINKDAEITFLFNSLDQLKSRFPLCAKQNIFIPGLIGMLAAEKITNIFVSAAELGQPEEQYGLMSMADVILETSRNSSSSYKLDSSVVNIQKYEVEAIRYFESKLQRKESKVFLHVKRIAGAKEAGQIGLLDLISSKEEKYGLKNGLHLIPVINE